MKELPNEWWGNFTVGVGTAAQWEIGPLRIAVQRSLREWLIAHKQIDTTEGQQEWRFDYSDLDLNESEFANVPVPYLSLFHSSENTLWTETVTVVQKRGATLAEFIIEKGPPASAIGAKLTASPRQNPQKGMLIRAFSALKLQGSD